MIWYRGFAWLTGEKRDVWLVKTFGLVLAAFGLALGDALRRGDPLPTRPAAAVASSVALAEAWYVARGRIRPVYLIDALVEAGLVVRLLRR